MLNIRHIHSVVVGYWLCPVLRIDLKQMILSHFVRLAIANNLAIYYPILFFFLDTSVV